MSVLIKNGIIGTAERSFRGDLLIEDEKIAAVGGSLYCGGAEVIDAAGRYLLPGGVDPHTHVMLRAGENSVSTGSRRRRARRFSEARPPLSSTLVLPRRKTLLPGPSN